MKDHGLIESMLLLVRDA